MGTGDFLGDPDAVPGVLKVLEGVRGRVASFFVLGSNDYYAPVPKNPLRYLRGPSSRHGGPGGSPNPWPLMVKGLQECGWELIANRVLEIGGVEVLGLDDPHIGKDDMSLARARTGDGFRLAVAHSPDPALALARLEYDLILSGHTHGGQLRIPGIGALVTNTKGLPRRMARGVHAVGTAWVHVSAGLGTSKYAPFRFACRPEVCLLELVPRVPDQSRSASSRSNARS